MNYKVILIESEEGYAIGCPALPGCWSQGDTREDAIGNIQDAIRLYLEVREEMLTQDLVSERTELAEVFV